MKNKKGEIFRKETKDCADCGRKMTVYIYADRNKKNRGGHYFGQIGICPKKENEKMFKSGTRKSKFGNPAWNVYKYEAKPHKYLEHWECPKCYWGRRIPKPPKPKIAKRLNGKASLSCSVVIANAKPFSTGRMTAGRFRVQGRK